MGVRGDKGDAMGVLHGGSTNVLGGQALTREAGSDDPVWDVSLDIE